MPSSMMSPSFVKSPPQPPSVPTTASLVAEDLVFSSEQQTAYDAATIYLEEVTSTHFLAMMPTLVSLDAAIPLHDDDDDDNDDGGENKDRKMSKRDSMGSFLATTRGGVPQYLDKALDVLEEGLEKEEQTLAAQTTLTRQLTELIMDIDTTAPTTTTTTDASAEAALQSIVALGRAIPRRVCQHPFRKNDIVWVCRTCQADETCVLCHACFSQSQHEGHDVAFYHAQAGGCCDCGDPDAWDPAGFCPHHGPNVTVSSSSHAALPPSLVTRVRGVVPSCVDWLVQKVASHAEVAYDRAHPTKKMKNAVVARSRSVTSMDRMDVDEINEYPNYNFNADEDEIFEEYHRTHVFDPTAASTSASFGSSKSNTDTKLPRANEAAQDLAATGCAGHGLYLVLHADDIHSTYQLMDALRDFFGISIYSSEKVLGRLVRALRRFGQLIIFGTLELVQECGATQVHLWMDGDRVASGRIGAVLLDRTRCFTRLGLFCSIVTRVELILEQRAVAVLQWLSAVARSCDPLCLTVAECILPNRHLVPLLRADFKMSARITKAWYSLLLTILAVPTFKSHLAAAYCDTYRYVTAKYARGMGVLERSGYTLSVQFLNRVNYVIDLVQGRDLLGKLGLSLLETLQVASCDSKNKRLDPNHFVLTHRRYSPCVSDLKCVLNVKGMPRIIACRGGTFLNDWIASLSLVQFLDDQVWRHWSQGHVETESRGWVGAFNASISLGSLFERLLGWADEEMSPISVGPLSRDLMNCVEMTFHILTNGVFVWQQNERLSYESTAYESLATSEFHKYSPASLPFSNIAAKHGSALAMRQLPVSQVSPFSFHLPLHRFVAGCLRELCLRDESKGIAELLRKIRTKLPQNQQNDLLEGLMEFPLVVLSRAAQIRGGLWRRNGGGLNDQVLNYAEPPFCRNMRDADLLLTQFATIGRTHHLCSEPRPSDVGMSFLVNLMLHRFGIFDFVGMAKAPDSQVDVYTHQMTIELFPPERGSSDSKGPHLPFTYSLGRDSASCMVLLEEYLHFMIVFVTDLPPITPRNHDEQTQQAKFRLMREVVHRLASGPKTHSELSEVHHVLSHWDNVLLSEEGKHVNPDDATGAALGAVLSETAERKESRAKMEPDKWEIKRSSWDLYDPAFFHISLRSHQIAAECRPRPTESPDNTLFGCEARPYAPPPIAAHGFFDRLRRDATADATTLAVAYRVLHLHCRENFKKDLTGLLGTSLYASSEKSETALARTIHFLTLGAYAWKDAQTDDYDWERKGGGSVGSIFWSKEIAPNAADWINDFLLAEPSTLTDCEWYGGEERALTLLERLATSGGTPGGFVAQDSVVRSGAAWLCEFALKFSFEARSMLRPIKGSALNVDAKAKTESDSERRKKLAKKKMEEAMARMKAQAEKFAIANDVLLGSDDESVQTSSRDVSTPSTPVEISRPLRKASFGSNHSSGSSFGLGEIDSDGNPGFVTFGDNNDDFLDAPPRLLQSRPRCIICNDEDGSDTRTFDGDGESHRKKSRRRLENALGFVGYIQASTVLKGGGGPPFDSSPLMSPIRDFVGMHVALCGHAVHSECCESYLATVSHREDRQNSKRDEFRCPLCQRLSNCLVPFIDVGVDWIELPSSLPVIKESDQRMIIEKQHDRNVNCANNRKPSSSLHDFLEQTPWWVARKGGDFVWDGQSAFVEFQNVGESSIDDPSVPTFTDGDEDSPFRKPTRRIRSLKKKDLYAAWNGMMRTPRFVRRKLRQSNLRSSPVDIDVSNFTLTQTTASSGEDSIGETVVWRRFIDQISDISYRVDSKRRDEDHSPDYFGEFRHYIVEKFAYNVANRFSVTEPTDWPSCIFKDILSDNRKQEMSREKLLSKLLQSIQAFTYSCCCEAFEARREYRKILSAHSHAASKTQDSSNAESVLSKYGIGGVVCNGQVILIPPPSAREDEGAGAFDGRIGRLRYFALTVMAAAGAVAADLIQLALPFPLGQRNIVNESMDVENPHRAPIAFPLLFGNVLTHIVAALCASCGRARARSDSLDIIWPVPFSPKGSFLSSDSPRGRSIDTLVDDCEGFLKLGLLARMLQVLLGKLDVNLCNISNQYRSRFTFLGDVILSSDSLSSADKKWMCTCSRLLDIAIVSEVVVDHDDSSPDMLPLDKFQTVCHLAAWAGAKFLADAGTIFQILVPGALAKYATHQISNSGITNNSTSTVESLEQILDFFLLGSVESMLKSTLIRQVAANWFDAACCHAIAAQVEDGSKVSLQNRIHITQGFHVFDWPSAGTFDDGADWVMGIGHSLKVQHQQTLNHDDLSVSIIPSQYGVTSTTADVLRAATSPTLLVFNSKDCVSLLGGFSPSYLNKGNKDTCSRVSAIPMSYTDLYAELGTLMPDCDQTAVCLICGSVLNAAGKGECTRHSYKCGAGTGIFFLLQECSGLLLHKSKAAYIHSPYVDSHGETPQYRGRPLNLDLDRYEHLREVWFSHGVRQKVVSERVSSRQVILPDWY